MQQLMYITLLIAILFFRGASSTRVPHCRGQYQSVGVIAAAIYLVVAVQEGQYLLLGLIVSTVCITATYRVWVS